MSSTQLRENIEFAVAEGRESKSAFLSSLAKILRDLKSAESVNALLNRAQELPVEESRLRLSDLPRRIASISWHQPDAVVSGIGEIVNECVTVAGGDCETCMGEELVFMWNSSGSKIVLHCRLCGNTRNRNGDQITESKRLVEATTAQLKDAGVI